MLFSDCEFIFQYLFQIFFIVQADVPAFHSVRASEGNIFSLVRPCDLVAEPLHLPHKIRAAAAAVQEIKDDIKGIGDKLFIKGALHAIAEAVLLARGITFRQLLDGEGEAVAVRGTTQDVIAGDPVEIGGAHQKIKTAFPDAVFIMGKQSLGDPKLLCGTLLADALFFS